MAKRQAFRDSKGRFIKPPKRRGVFRDRGGHFTKPDRRKVFSVEVEGKRSALRRWTKQELEKAMAAPPRRRRARRKKRRPRKKRLGPGQSKTVKYEINTPADLDNIVTVAPLGAQGARITIVFPEIDGETKTAKSFELFGVDEAFGRQWEVLNHLGVTGTEELNEILEHGPILIKVRYLG